MVPQLSEALSDGIEPWLPTERQDLALTCDCDEILYGGAKGGGKSEWLLLDSVRHMAIADAAWRETGIKSRGRGVLFRKDFTRMEDLNERAKYLFQQIDPGVEPNVQKHAWTFSCGWRFMLAQLHEDGAEQQWQGQQIDWLGVDQAEELPWKQIEFLMMQNRTTDRALRGHECMRLTANTIGEYVTWVKDRYIKGSEPHQIQEEDVEFPDGSKEVLTRVFIPAMPKDNPHLDRKYWAKLLRLPPDLRAAFMFGDWNVVVGSFFAEAWDRRVHVIKPFPIPRHGELFMSGDWGADGPACALLNWRDQDNNFVVLSELYGPGVTGRKWGERILRWLQGLGVDPRRIIGYLDDNAWQRHGSDGMTPGEKMVQMGLRWFPAEKGPGSVAAGLTELRERLLLRAGPEGRTPGIAIFDTCTHLIEDITGAQRDDKDVEVTSRKQRLDCLDALRYGVGAYPVQEWQRTRVDETVLEWQSLLNEQQALRGLGGGRTGSSSFCGYG